MRASVGHSGDQEVIQDWMTACWLASESSLNGVKYPVLIRLPSRVLGFAQ